MPVKAGVSKISNICVCKRKITLCWVNLFKNGTYMVNGLSILAVVWCYLHNKLVSGSIIPVFIGILYFLFAHWKIQKKSEEFS